MIHNHEVESSSLSPATDNQGVATLQLLIFMPVVRGPVMPAGEMCGKICSECTLYMEEDDAMLGSMRGWAVKAASCSAVGCAALKFFVSLS